MNKFLKIFFHTIIFPLWGLGGCFGQGGFTLEQCIDYALRNNFDVKQQELRVKTNENNLQQSKMAMLPNLSGSFSHSLYFGRNIDPYSNQFVENNISSNSLGLGTNITLFNGFQLKNQIKQNELNLSAEITAIQRQKNELTINIMLAYMQALLSQDILKTAQEQVKNIKTQFERTKALVQEGVLPKTNIIDLEAQLASSEFDVVSAKTNFDLAKLTLAQSLNWRENRPLEIATQEIKEPTVLPSQDDLKQEIQQATNRQPVVKVAEFRLESAVLGVDLAKSGLFPTISAGAGLGTSYSSAAPSQRFIVDNSGEKTITSTSNSQFVNLNGVKYPLTTISTLPNGSYKDFTYFDQLSSNFNKYIRLSVNIPIFSNGQAKNRVANALINQKSAEFDLQKVKIQLQQQIEQAYANLTASYEKFKSAKRQVDAQKVAFESASARFEEGLIHSIELNNFRVNLEKAKSSLIQAKYEYAFRKMILEFYR
jgi:outer membrane protein